MQLLRQGTGDLEPGQKGPGAQADDGDGGQHLHYPEQDLCAGAAPPRRGRAGARRPHPALHRWPGAAGRGLTGRRGRFGRVFAQHQRRLADGDAVAKAQVIGPVDLQAVDVGSVGAAPVHHFPLATVPAQVAVVTGGPVVAQGDVALFGAAHRPQRLLGGVQKESLTGPSRPFLQDQPGFHPPPRSLLKAPGRSRACPERRLITGPNPSRPASNRC